MTRPDVFIFAGEASGDLHGGALISELFKLKKDIQIQAVAGPMMRQHAINTVIPMEEFQVMGFIDVFIALPRIAHLFYKLARQILRSNPKACVFIDYPGFNLRMESYLRKKGYKGKLIHYISPTVWIHGRGRIATMAKTLDALLCILPFEPECYKGTELNVSYVGHPLTERVAAHSFTPIEELKGKKVIALFPGSRKKEIERNLPLYLDLVKKWGQHHKEITFSISVSRKEHRPLIEKMISSNQCHNTLCVEEERTYDLMHMSFAAIAKSGTVTLELALHSVPTCVTYAVTKIDVFIAQKLLHVDLPFYALPNILAKKKIFPELIGPYFTFENLEKEALNLLDTKERDRQKRLCQDLHTILGSSRASSSAAREVYEAICRS